MNKYYLYITANNKKDFEIKISRDLPGRLFSLKKLVYYEVFKNKSEIEKRKKEISNWHPKKIYLLIDLVNPNWNDWKKDILDYEFNRTNHLLCI